MKGLSKFTLLSGFILALHPTTTHALSISEQQINTYLQTRLAEKIPLENRIGIPHLFELDYKLHHLSTQIGQTAEKRVAVIGVVSGRLTSKAKPHQAEIRLHFDTLPYYDPAQGALYLKQLRLLNWSVSPEKYQHELHTFLPLLTDGLTNLLNHTPVYTLDETKTKEAIIKKLGKAIVVKQGELVLETEIF